VERRFLFHWIIMVVIETARGVTTRVLFLPVILTRFQEWNPFYPNQGKRVNII
jgi:hypothetical protein